MKIKKGPFGYFVAEPLADVHGNELPIHRANSEYPLQVGYNREGIRCPLKPYDKVSVQATDGKWYWFCTGHMKMLTNIYLHDDPTMTAVDEVDIDPENGIWFFLNGIPREKVPH